MPFSLFSQAQIPPAAAANPATEVWWSGIIAKVQKDQSDNYIAGNESGNPRVWFPTDYEAEYQDLASFPGSVYHKLLNQKWMKGIQIDLEWGRIETSAGVYNWTKYDNILNTVRDLASKGPNGVDKKVLFLLPCKTFDIDDAERAIPAYLRTTTTPYSNSTNGPLYKISQSENPTPPHHVFIDMPRYTQAIFGYRSSSTQDGALPFGYHYRFADLRDTETNAFKTALQAFLTAMYAHYKDHAAFGGLVTIEPSPVTFAGAPSSAVVSAEYNRNTHFLGRLHMLKWLRGIMTNHMLIEAGNHDNAWEQDMMGPGHNIDGCLANHIGATGPNFHLGANLHGIYDAVTNLAGKVPIMVQCQPQDSKDLNGGMTVSQAGINDYYDWRYELDGHNTSEANPWGPLKEDTGVTPITNGDYIIKRALFLKANIFNMQMNTAADNPFNWDDFEFYMNNITTLTSANTGGNIKLDPSGGMIATKPQFVV